MNQEDVRIQLEAQWADFIALYPEFAKGDREQSSKKASISLYDHLQNVKNDAHEIWRNGAKRQGRTERFKPVAFVDNGKYQNVIAQEGESLRSLLNRTSGVPDEFKIYSDENLAKYFRIKNRVLEQNILEVTVDKIVANSNLAHDAAFGVEEAYFSFLKEIWGKINETDWNDKSEVIKLVKKMAAFQNKLWRERLGNKEIANENRYVGEWEKLSFSQQEADLWQVEGLIKQFFSIGKLQMNPNSSPVLVKISQAFNELKRNISDGRESLAFLLSNSKTLNRDNFRPTLNDLGKFEVFQNDATESAEQKANKKLNELLSKLPNNQRINIYKIVRTIDSSGQVISAQIMENHSLLNLNQLSQGWKEIYERLYSGALSELSEVINKGLIQNRGAGDHVLTQFIESKVRNLFAVYSSHYNQKSFQDVQILDYSEIDPQMKIKLMGLVEQAALSLKMDSSSGFLQTLSTMRTDAKSQLDGIKNFISSNSNSYSFALRNEIGKIYLSNQVEMALLENPTLSRDNLLIGNILDEKGNKVSILSVDLKNVKDIRSLGPTISSIAMKFNYAGTILENSGLRQVRDSEIPTKLVNAAAEFINTYDLYRRDSDSLKDDVRKKLKMQLDQLQKKWQDSGSTIEASAIKNKIDSIFEELLNEYASQLSLLRNKYQNNQQLSEVKNTTYSDLSARSREEAARLFMEVVNMELVDKPKVKSVANASLLNLLFDVESIQHIEKRMHDEWRLTQKGVRSVRYIPINGIDGIKPVNETNFLAASENVSGKVREGKNSDGFKNFITIQELENLSSTPQFDKLTDKSKKEILDVIKVYQNQKDVVLANILNLDADQIPEGANRNGMGAVQAFKIALEIIKKLSTEQNNSKDLEIIIKTKLAEMAVKWEESNRGSSDALANARSGFDKWDSFYRGMNINPLKLAIEILGARQSAMTIKDPLNSTKSIKPEKIAGAIKSLSEVILKLETTSTSSALASKTKSIEVKNESSRSGSTNGTVMSCFSLFKK